MTRNEAFEGKGSSFTIEDAVLFYARLTVDTMDNYEGKERFKVTLQVTPELGAKMEEGGFNTKQDDEGNYYIDAFKNRVIGKKEEERVIQKPPKVVFEDGTLWDIEEHGSIGNGTVADVEVFAKYVKVGKNWHLPMYLNKVIIKDFVPYEGEKKSNKDIF